MQTAIVLLLIIFSAFYLLRSMVKYFKKDGAKKCSGCSED